MRKDCVRLIFSGKETIGGPNVEKPKSVEKPTTETDAKLANAEKHSEDTIGFFGNMKNALLSLWGAGKDVGSTVKQSGTNATEHKAGWTDLAVVGGAGLGIYGVGKLLFGSKDDEPNNNNKDTKESDDGQAHSTTYSHTNDSWQTRDKNGKLIDAGMGKKKQGFFAKLKNLFS